VGEWSVRRLRSSEWLLIAYFTYVALIAPWFITAWRAWAMAALVAAIVWGLAYTRSLARDVAPVVLALLAYREMNWFSSAIHDHHLERSWIIWDRRLLDEWHLRAIIEGSGVLLPSYLELCYLLVYVVGITSVLVLVLNHRRDRIDEFLLAYLAGTLGAYGMFPYFPSDPPRVVFPGADLPNIVTWVRQFNLWIVGGYGIHSSVFPSAHVSLVFSAAWGLLATIPDRRWIGWLMVAYACSVAVATVYGRYHYAVDAVAGIAMSLLAVAALKLRSVYIG
jgi:membrane-associated phospholipid phosphatase